MANACYNLRQKSEAKSIHHGAIEVKRVAQRQTNLQFIMQQTFNSINTFG